MTSPDVEVDAVARWRYMILGYIDGKEQSMSKELDILLAHEV